MNKYQVFYTISGFDGVDEIYAASAAEAMVSMENMLLAWGYPNNSIHVDFARLVNE